MVISWMGKEEWEGVQLRSRIDCMMTADISSTDLVDELRKGTRLRRYRSSARRSSSVHCARLE